MTQNKPTPEQIGQIPKGSYCYNFFDRIKGEAFKPCPFYRHIKDEDGECRLTGNYIPDQLKWCDHNWATDEEWERTQQ
jgi:hypothetical protein